MRGEDLQGLNIDELQKLEMIWNLDLNAFHTKDDRITNEVSCLENKGAMLLEENKQLKQKMAAMCKGKTTDVVVGEEGMSSESITNNVCSCSSSCPSLEDDSSDTYLKLG
ncbi:Detected protein of confused Function [Hibiscus syriacus]|uniref:Detected protein of confused Function n=1 Tax=Hibiscus syriacus TaxID=106335 RepID=A0A6A3AFU0_HIBSY|nr:Detected protein of confused Function [Hibiscus syriacus]